MGDRASSSHSGGAGGETMVIEGGRRQTSCGYCQSNRHSSISHGLWAKSMTPYDYQELLDRGWRRSGQFLYKPEMESTCCPSYTIRLKVSDFCPSREQLRVHKRMERFLDGSIQQNNSNCSKTKQNCHDHSPNLTGKDSPASTVGLAATESSDASSGKLCKEDEILRYLSNKIDEAVRGAFGNEDLLIAHVPNAVVKRVTHQAKRKLESDDLLYTSSISFQIAATIKRHCSSESIRCHGSLAFDVSPTDTAEKLAGLLKQYVEPHDILIKACNGHLNFYSLKGIDSKSISSNENAQASKLSYMSCAGSIEFLPCKRRKLEVRMVTSRFDPQEFNLYRKYQIKVHNDRPEKVTESSYRSFLVDTPLTFIPARSGQKNIPPCGFGSFHQQYLIDGKLVAVGVVDILPRCLSSKYMFWDPDFAFLSLGKYSALQEIDWVKETQKHCPSLQFYYLGYYIHSCSKMRYKAAYHPSELLCPLRYKWVPFEIAKPLLDRNPYVVLSDYLGPQNLAMSTNLVRTIGQLSSSLDKTGQEETNEDEEDALWYDDPETIGGDEPETLSSDMSMTDELRDTLISDILLHINGSRVRFKDLEQKFGPVKRKVLDKLKTQLQEYVKVVGKELADRMIYSPF